MKDPQLVFEDEAFSVRHSDECGVPGYFVVRHQRGASSLSGLSGDEIQRFGVLVARLVRTIERVADADRVYLLSFCELDRRFHVHLFPRSKQLLNAFDRAVGHGDAGVNGPVLFEWARQAIPASAAAPDGLPSVDEVCRKVRAQLAQTD